MSTLLEELEQALERAEARAEAGFSAAADDPRLGGYSDEHVHAAEAAKLRARIEHIKAMDPTLRPHTGIEACLYDNLIGDLP
jgi:hypothetical protein